MKNEMADFGLFAGMSIEMLLKLRLAMENPTFIASAKGFKHALELQKNAGDVNKLPSTLKTIGGSEAVTRAVEIVSGLDALAANVREMVDVRNGEAHLALSDKTQLRRVLNTLLRASELLMPSDKPWAAFWGSNADFARKTLDERQSAMTYDVNLKLAAAKQHYRDRYRHLSAKEKAAVEEVAKTFVELNADIEESRRRKCPACAQDGLASGHLEDHEDVDYDHREGVVTNVYLYFTFHAHSFACPSCELRLNSAEEMEIAGMESEWDDDVMDAQLWAERNEAYYEDR